MEVAVVFDSARPWRRPGDRIDSILPMPEYLRRFRHGLAEPARLVGGAATKEALARGFLDAVSRRDTAALAELLVSRAEFAWLVFPQHRYARPPYDLDPEIFWGQLGSASGRGIRQTLQQYGGQPLEFLGFKCDVDTLQLDAGPARMWNWCRVRFRDPSGVHAARLFGSIVERGGRSKLVSLARDF